MVEEKISIREELSQKECKMVVPKSPPKPDSTFTSLPVGLTISKKEKKHRVRESHSKVKPGNYQRTLTRTERTLEIGKEIGTPCQHHVILNDVKVLDQEDVYSIREYGKYAYCSHRWFLSLEEQSVPCEGFFTNLGEDGERRRASMIDLFVQIAEVFGLISETLFRAVNIFDRYISTKYVEEERHLLVGITCLNIACKYEERMKRGAERFVRECRLPFNKKDIIQAEVVILDCLSFKLTLPTPLTFACRFNIIGMEAFKGEEVYYTAMILFFLHMAMLSSKISTRWPSLIAASVFHLCANIAGKKCGLETSARHYFGNWNDEDMEWIMKDLTRLVQNNGNFDGKGEFSAVFDKFSSSDFSQVARRVTAKLNGSSLSL